MSSGLVAESWSQLTPAGSLTRTPVWTGFPPLCLAFGSGRSQIVSFMWRAVGALCYFGIDLKASAVGADREIPTAYGIRHTSPAGKMFHDVPCSSESIPFDSSVLKMKFVLADGTSPRVERREMQISRSCALAFPGPQAA